jgi:hypothetical protein
LSESISYEPKGTITFPDERDAAAKLYEGSPLRYQHSIIATNFPSMSGAFEDLDKHIENIMETALLPNNLSSTVGDTMDTAP